ncbi:MAG: hypothetical protein ABSE41_08735 [Bacteroidota bacterium]|jgi:hypothetical protein
MKPTNYFHVLCLIAVILISGCSRSDEQVKRIIKLGTEIAELQRQYYPAATELGKVAVQIEAIAQRQDPKAKAVASDVAKAHAQIAEAFAAGQKALDSFVAKPDMEVSRYIAAEEVSRDLLKEALDKTNAAVSKSHEVLDTVANPQTVHGIGKK